MPTVFAGAPTCRRRKRLRERLPSLPQHNNIKDVGPFGRGLVGRQCQLLLCAGLLWLPLYARRLYHHQNDDHRQLFRTALIVRSARGAQGGLLCVGIYLPTTGVHMAPRSAVSRSILSHVHLIAPPGPTLQTVRTIAIIVSRSRYSRSL